MKDLPNLRSQRLVRYKGKLKLIKKDTRRELRGEVYFDHY